MQLRASDVVYNTSLSQISAKNRSSGVSVPVARNQFIYSQYKHVKGYPAGESQRTVPLVKVRMLNNIIENLSRAKKDDLVSQESIGKLSDEAIDSLIKQYADELHQAVSTPAVASYAGIGDLTGMNVSLSA